MCTPSGKHLHKGAQGACSLSVAKTLTFKGCLILERVSCERISAPPYQVFDKKAIFEGLSDSAHLPGWGFFLKMGTHGFTWPSGNVLVYCAVITISDIRVWSLKCGHRYTFRQANDDNYFTMKFRHTCICILRKSCDYEKNDPFLVLFQTLRHMCVSDLKMRPLCFIFLKREAHLRLNFHNNGTRRPFWNMETHVCLQCKYPAVLCHFFQVQVHVRLNLQTKGTKKRHFTIGGTHVSHNGRSGRK